MGFWFRIFHILKNSMVHILQNYIILWDLGQHLVNLYTDISAASGLDKDHKNHHVNLATNS